MAENQEEAFTFRLFARKLGAPTLSSNECSDPPKVVLRSPAPENRSPQFLVSRKSDSHYFTGRFDTAKAEQYREAVVTGEDIIERSRQRWPGSEMPWRVMVITSAGSTQSSNVLIQTNPVNNKRKRKGKKSRIAIRKKLSAQRETELARRLDREVKEAAWKQKKMSKNRKKKLKMRAKKVSKRALTTNDNIQKT